MGDAEVQLVVAEGGAYQGIRIVNLKGKRVLARTTRVSDGCECFIKVLNGSEAEQSKLTMEWLFLQKIGVREGILQGLEVIKTSLGLGLVTKYVPGVSILKCELFSDATRVSREGLLKFCRVAVQACEALGWVHKADIVHRDISESNIIYDPSSGRVTIIDFGLSAPPGSTPQAVVGTWKYISPEQTGRTSLPIDCRADLYSLGAVLYELAAGRPLFLGNDALGLIHQHLTAETTSLHDLRFGIPVMLSKVVMKLVEKHPNHRYQSAWGAMFDFKRCLNQLEQQDTTEIPVFELGTKDIPNTIRRPTTLYGREEQMQSLRRTLAEVRTGCLRLVLVSGTSGSGKSSLAKELHRETQRSDVVWLGSKLDQYTRVPYGCFLPLFEQFVDRVLTFDPKEFAAFRQDILEKLDGVGKLLYNCFPMLQLLLGDQKSPPEMIPSEERKKFLQACRAFFSCCFALKGQPVVLFLDDMQWADATSLTLLQVLCELRDLPILVLCGYRSEEVDSNHVLRLTVDKITESGTPVSFVAVENLDHSQLCTLLTDTFQGRCNALMVPKLATFMLTRTLGNPFFVTQFLDALHQQKAIQFERTEEEGEWIWHQGIVITENVLELLVKKIKTVPPRCQEILRMAALVGSTVEVSTMNVMTSIPEEQIQGDLLSLVDMGLLVPVDQDTISRATTVTMHSTDLPSSSTHSYRFLHDRVQQAASSLFVDAEERAKAHYRLGSTMWEGKATKEHQKLFAIANHLLEGVRFIKPEQKLEVCELFLRAGKHARKGMSSAYAQKYLSTIIDMIPSTNENWQTHGKLLRSCFFELHEASFQIGQMQLASSQLNVILNHSITSVEKAEVLDKLAAVAAGSDNMVQAVKLCLETLASFGIHFPSEGLDQALKTEHELFRKNLAEHKINDLTELLNLPLVDTPEKVCVARAFKSCMAPLYLTNPPLHRVVAATCVNWSIKNGISTYMCYPYGMFAMVLLWSFDDKIGAQALATTCLAISDKFGKASDHYRACLVVGACIFNWTRSHADADAVLEQGQVLANAYGDYVFCSFIYLVRAFQVYSNPTLMADMALYRELLDGNQKHGAGILNSKGTIEAMLLCNLCLQGKSKNSFSFSVDGLVEDVDSWVADNIAENRISALTTFYIMKAFTQFVMFDAKGAFDTLEKARPLVPFMAGCQLNAPFRFLEALTRLQMIAPSHSAPCKGRPIQPGPCTEDEARTFFVTIDQCLVMFENWAKSGPKTYLQMLYIVYAEKRRVLRANPSFVRLDPRIFVDHVLESKERHELYRMAIMSATDSGVTVHLALAHELTMRFWQTQGEVDYARVHWRAAMMAYYTWGARAKINLLKEEYDYASLTPCFDNPPAAESASCPLVLYDKQAIFAASRLISSEIVLDKLLVNLMGVIAEHVGATFGLLLSYEEDKWKVECSYGASTLRTGLPTTILNFVYKKHEVVVLSDAATHETYHRDPYIAQYKPKSVLCVPIVLHGHFINAVYLENNGFEGTFTTGLSEVAELLASQAATAIQNGRLYRRLNDYNLSLEEQVRERTSQLSTAREHADQANKAKSTFLASMSHEIRTPMNGIMASMELLKMTRLTDEQTELADVVITCADALLVLINDILDLSKIEADKLELECVWFDLQRCLESVLDILAPKAFPKGLDIEFQTWGPPEEKLEVVVKGQKRIFCADVPRVIRGDYTRFRQILVNLCNNAVKFTRLGEVTIKVWWRPLEEHKDRFLGQPVELYFSVLDTGIGMPAARLPMLFKAFSQVENSTTRKYGGTGLGLAICQPLVQLMGGSIWVESEEGKGSNFQFTITTSCQDLNAVQCVNTVSDAKTPTLRPGLRVLLVQDASACASIFKGSLEKLGCVSTRASLAEGLPLLQTQIFDVCIVDWAPKSIEEPNMVCGEEELHMVTRTKHGERFIDEFRAWEITQQLTGRLPIVLSSYDRQHRIGPLIDGFLIKPTKQRHVLKVLNSVTQSARSSCSFTDAVKVHLRPDTASVASKSELKLMMAEDNKINVRMATKMVESVGYSMTIVHNGRQAVDQVKAWYEGGTPCQVLLMDVQMPVMDGLEATAMIRSSSIPVSEQPYIIALTANAMASDRLMCLQAGMNDYLSKPLNRQDLARALRTAALAKGVIVSELNVPYNASP